MITLCGLKSKCNAELRQLRPLRHRAPNPIELPQVQQVMPRIESTHVLDTLFTPLRVNADPPQIFARRTPQESKIRTAQYGEILQRLVGVGSVVPKSFRPQVLVVSGQLRTIVGQHHAESIAPHKF